MAGIAGGMEAGRAATGVAGVRPGNHPVAAGGGHCAEPQGGMDRADGVACTLTLLQSICREHLDFGTEHVLQS